MTPTPQSDEWIKTDSDLTKLGFVTFVKKGRTERDKIVEHTYATLIDQIRRDAVDDFKNSFENISVIQRLIDAKVQEAKKELLDEIYEMSTASRRYNLGTGECKQSISISHEKFQELRAKTLGENVNKNGTM